MLLRRACLQALCIKTCARTRMSTALTALATTHRVVHRVHDNTTVVGAAAQPARTTGLSALLQRMVGVADHAYRCAACQKHFSSFSRRQFDDCVITFA